MTVPIRLVTGVQKTFNLSLKLMGKIMDDLFQNPEDSMEVEPVELGEVFADVLSSILAKRLADQYQKPWTDEMELNMQKKISTLVALANERNLWTIRVIVTRPSGQKVVQDMDVKRIGETRSLQ